MLHRELLVLQVRRIHGFAIRLDGRSGSVEVCGRFFSQIRLEQVHVPAFNGASNVAQGGGLAALSDEGGSLCKKRSVSTRKMRKC